MPPLRETVGLVEYPVPYLTLFEHAPDGNAPQLLRGDDQHARITETHLVQRVAAFRHGQQPVDGNCREDALTFQPQHLVSHESHQGRDDDGQRARLVVAGQRRHLVADGLAGACWQYGKRAAALHHPLDYRLLQ